jgi:hypothetical protein
MLLYHVVVVKLELCLARSLVTLTAALPMITDPIIQYSSAVRNPSLLSFESDASSETTSSEVTATSSSTIWGPGALAGKGLLSFGKAALRGATAIVIRTRLQALKSVFPHKDEGVAVDEKTQKGYRDLLELTRYGG